MGKVKSSAFWWFMYHMQEQEYRNTGRVPSMGQISERAGSIWRQMSAEEKQPFIDKHENYKAGPRPHLADFSVTLKNRREPRREIKEDPDAAISRPESRSSTVSGSVSVVEEQSRKKKLTSALGKFIEEATVETILKLKFHTMASNVMCATRNEIIDGCVTEDVYYPLEIGIAEFTLADGITYEYNQFVDPGPIPDNMARICHEHESKHEIPLTDFNCAKGCCKDPLTQEYIPEKRRKEFDDVMCDVHDLISNSVIEEIQDNPVNPVKLVFTQTDQIYQNKGVLKAIGKEAECDHFCDEFEVIDVSELFFFLSRKKGYKLKAGLLDILDCTKFNFDGRCEFHETRDTAICAITVAKKYVWLMLEHLSKLYGFELTEKHKPKGDTKNGIHISDEYFSWDTEAPVTTTKRPRYFTDTDDLRQPIKQARTVEWPESIGRGRILNYPKPSSHASPAPSSSSVFRSTDVRLRDGRLKQETETQEPIPGPSRTDYRPRLPGAEPVEPSPFRTYEPQIDNDTKPRVPPPIPIPATQVPIGRGRGRHMKIER